MENLGDEGISYATAKYLLISSTRKIPLNRFKSSTIKIVIPSPPNNSFHVITLSVLHLYLQSFLLHHLFNFKFYVHTWHGLIKYDGYQICDNKSYETPYLLAQSEILKNQKLDTIFVRTTNLKLGLVNFDFFESSEYKRQLNFGLFKKPFQNVN